MKRYLGGRESLACYFQEEGYLNELSKIELQQIAIDSILNCNRYAIEYLVWSIDDRDSLRKPEGLTIIKRLSENEILNLLDNILFFVEKRDDVKIKSFANEWVQKLVMEVIKRHFSGNLGTVRYWHERDLKLPSYISLDTDVNEIKNLFINDGPIVGLAISKYEGNPINDFTEIFGLAYLKDLKSLELHGFECPEITGLESQKELEKLNLDNNNIRDIKKLKKMTCLKELHLSCNHIKDIKGLTNLKQLESLWLVFNEIVELDGIETLISLKKLNLTKNSIENIDKIKTLTKLREIRLSGNKIRDFSPLDGLKELKATPSLK